MTRSRATSLFIHQKKNSILKNPSYFSNLKEVMRNAIKAIQNDIIKFVGFDLLVEEVPFKNPMIKHEPCVNLNNHSWQKPKISKFEILQ